MIGVSEIRSCYRQGRLIPFIGAGVSMSVTWEQDGHLRRGPSWKELVDQAARLIGFDIPDLARVRGTDLQILEYFGILNDGEYARLTHWLYHEMAAPDSVLRDSLVHRQLAELSLCNLFYTTNYDDYIERSFRLRGRECDRVAIEPHMGLSSDPACPPRCEVVKFHGDLDFPQSMVISESHYERRLALSTAMDYRFRADLLGRAVLFLGYSFRDWNVSYLFRLVNEQFKQLHHSRTGRRAYITVPEPSDFEIQLFRARNMEVVPISSKHQTADIANLLEEIRS